MKVAIIGLGSIGKFHLDILKKKKFITEILVITKRKIKNNIRIRYQKNIKNIVKFDPGYIVISSPTSKHYSNFNFIEKNLKKKIVLVEKPLFDKNYKVSKKLNNRYFVNFNLRELEILNYLKNFLQNKSFFEALVNCNSYLPNWRKNIEYSKSSSSKLSLGGGVLNDLSHEIDYILWIFGDFKKVFSYYKKLSNLKINSPDSFHSICYTKKKILKISLDYFSRIKSRQICVKSNDLQIIADLVKNKISLKYKNNKVRTINFKDKIKQTYEKVHNKILNKNFVNLCSLKDGIKVNNYIEILK